MNNINIVHGEPSQLQAVFHVQHMRRHVTVTFNLKPAIVLGRKTVAKFLKLWRKARLKVATYYTNFGYGGEPIPRIVRRREIKPYTLRWLACHKCCLMLVLGGHILRYWMYIPADYQTYSARSWKRKDTVWKF